MLPGVPNLCCSDEGFHHLADAMERFIIRSQIFIQRREMVSKPFSGKAGASQRLGIQDLGKYASKKHTIQCTTRGSICRVCPRPSECHSISSEFTFFLCVMICHLNAPRGLHARDFVSSMDAIGWKSCRTKGLCEARDVTGGMHVWKILRPGPFLSFPCFPDAMR